MRSKTLSATDCPAGNGPECPPGLRPIEPPRQPVAIHLRLSAFARANPHRLALSSGGRRATYGQLVHHARGLAEELCRLGVGPEQIVAVQASPGIEMVAAMLAVLEAGAAYLPIDPACPPTRREHLLADSGAVAIVTEPSAKTPAGIPQLAPGQISHFDRPREAGTGSPLLVPEPHPEQIAYLIYTSGSSGRPKGVAVPHRGLCALVDWHLETYGVTPEDRAGQVANPAFDAAVWEIWPYLAAGASVHMAPPEVRLSPPGLVRWLVDEHLDLAFLPTPLAEAVLDETWPETVALRALLTGGDRLQRRPRRLPFAVVNHYGPTECSVVATAGTVRPEGDDLPDIGSAITGTTIQLVDASDTTAGPAEVAEILIGGQGVARGYLARPGLTAESFVPDPTTPGARRYRSGDLARRRPDGRLDFVGRRDQQVKIRGVRVEPGEVAAELLRHPNVRDAAVVTAVVASAAAGSAASPAGAEQRLVAFAVPQTELDPQDLFQWLGARLPKVLVPRVFLVPALPLTAHGKIDRYALRHRAETLLESEATGEDPGAEGQSSDDPLVAEITSVFAAVLGISHLEPDRDFFAAGGHSLAVARVLARLHQDLALGLTPGDLFSAPTAVALAKRLQSGLGGQDRHPPLPPLGWPRARKRAPLSPAQEQLWLAEQLWPGAGNVVLASTARGELEVPRLALAWRRLSERHRILRATFIEVDGEVMQHPGATAPPQLPVIDLRGLPAPTRHARELLHHQGRRPMDLTTGPPLRLLLIRIDEAEWILGIVVHHLVFDGWSLPLALDELGTFYRAGTDQTGLRTLPFEYADAVVWQRALPVPDGRLDFWRRQLDDLPSTLELPTDRQRSPQPSFAAAETRGHLEPDLAGRLEALGKSAGATLFMTLAAGFQILLHRLSGARRMAIGFPVTGRDHPELERLIGMFVDTVVLRGDCAGQPDAREMLARTRHHTLAALGHRPFPSADLAETLAGRRQAGAHPLCSVMLAFQNTPPPRLDLGAPGPRFEAMQELDNGTVEFDLLLAVEPAADGGLATRLRWRRQLFDPTTGRRMLRWLETLLAGCAEHPEVIITDLPLLSTAERHQLCREWADGGPGPWETAAEVAPTLPEMLLAAARRYGDTPALLPAGQQPWSYTHLARHGLRLAAALHRAGVRAGHLVALCCPRGVELLSGLWGITSAGAAFLYLDPGLPLDRRKTLLAESRAQWVLGSRREVQSTDEVHMDTQSDPRNEIHPHLLVLEDLDQLERSDHHQQDHDQHRPAPAPESVAYVIHTSGSSGRPKGVVVSHQALCRRLQALQLDLRLQPKDRVLQLLAPGFDAALQEMLVPLTVGATLVLHPSPDLLDGPNLIDLCRQHSIHALFFPAAWWHRVVDELPATTHLPPTLRLCVVGGESPCPQRLQRWLRASSPGARYPDETGARLFNQYGPTEAVIVATRWRVDGTSRGPVSIGRPLVDTRVEVVGVDGRPLPRGVPGELLIGGGCLARGYQHRPAATAEHWIPAAAGPPGARLYRSGDRVRFLADGSLEFLGRLDGQLKIRGHRVEPEEIEAALRDHPDVAQAAVVPRGSGAEQTLVAYYTTSAGSGSDLDEHTLRRFLGDLLPAAWVPAACLHLDTLPLTRHGKVDRAALRHRTAGPLERPGGLSPYAAPRNPVEEAIVRWMAEALGRTQVGIHDDFFELGGHSLLATRLLSRLRSHFGIELSLGNFFARPTVAALAETVAARGACEGTRTAGAGQPASDDSDPAAASATTTQIGRRARHNAVEDLNDDEVAGLLQQLLARPETTP